MNNPKEGDLQVWWTPLFGDSGLFEFMADVESVAQGVQLMRDLSAYDEYLFDKGLLKDTNSHGWMLRFKNGGWEAWEDDATGETDPEAWLDANSGL